MIEKEVEEKGEVSSRLPNIITRKTVINCSQCPLEEGRK